MFLLIACEYHPELGPVCTSELRSGLVLHVFDAETEEKINCDVKVIIRDENFEYQLFKPDWFALNCNVEFPVAWNEEREGDYDIEVYKTGYQTFFEENIVIKLDGKCHVKPVYMTVYLEPL